MTTTVQEEDFVTAGSASAPWRTKVMVSASRPSWPE